MPPAPPAPGRFQLKEAKEALAASRKREADLKRANEELRAKVESFHGLRALTEATEETNANLRAEAQDQARRCREDREALDITKGALEKARADCARTIADLATAHQRLREAERLKKQHAEDAKRKAEEDAEKALIEAESGERAAQREADKLRRELEAKAAAEKAANPTFEQESVSLSALGFMTLKKKLVERGVPQADVNKAANKFALKEIASKYDCKITFVD